MIDLQTIQRRHQDGGTGDIIVKRMAMKTPTVKIDKRIIAGLVSTDGVDMDGDVVIQDGIDTSYFWEADAEAGVRTVYLDHDYSMPVGTCRNLTLRSDGLYGTTYVTRLPVGDEILTLVDEGILRGQSIGFRVQVADEPSAEERIRYGAKCKRIIRKSTLLEYSVTAMPCNPESTLHLAELVGKSRVSKRMADLIAPPVKIEEPQMVITSGGVFTIR